VFVVVVYFVTDSVWKLLDTPSYIHMNMKQFSIIYCYLSACVILGLYWDYAVGC